MAFLKHGLITREIIGAAFEVHRVLGYGFLEKVYQRAMVVELQRRGVRVEMERPIRVMFKGAIVGEYAADLLVDEKVLVELKVARKYNPKDEAQLLNELKATGIEVGLLVNFGEDKAKCKRLVLSGAAALVPDMATAEE